MTLAKTNAPGGQGDSSQNERTLGAWGRGEGGGVLKNKQGQIRGEGSWGQNSEILREHTF